MQKNLPSVRAIEARDIDDVGDLLGRAFINDPAMTWMVRHPSAQQRLLCRQFRILAGILHAFGHGTLADDGLGAIFWIDPPGHFSLGKLRQLMLMAATIRAVGFDNFKRFGESQEWLGRFHPKESHIYLACVGVAPHAQGKGVGRLLIEPGLQRADQLGVPVYLDTSTETNVSLYQRFGFEVIAEDRLTKDGGPPMWFMLRPTPNYRK
ncbi:MAG: GNAT family N-acetyltransferase [Sphingorhabdus sp.]